MENMVTLKINNKEITVPSNYTVLQAAKAANIHIPTLCYLKDINEIGACRICVVEIKGARSLQAACVYPVSNGLEVFTNSEKVRKSRRITLELLLSNHDKRCLTCSRNRNCELQTLAEEFGLNELTYEGERSVFEIDNQSTSIVRDNNKCILCRRCIAACDKQAIKVIQAKERGFITNIGAAFDISMAEAPCIYCGQCITACPTGALTERDDTGKVWAAIQDSTKHVVFQTAPAVRAALGEEFGLPIGTPVTGKMVTAIKELGADRAFDTDTGADLTIMEEGTEFINRFTKGENLPLITSCSPGWVKFCEHYYPEFTDNLSSCKSPMEMFGAVLKTYYCEKNNIDPKDLYVVAVMPCTSKKFEASREEMGRDGIKDIDASITTRELAKMIKSAGIDFNALEESHFDQPFGDATGAAVIFGATGGVMEAALRTVSEILTGKELESVDFEAVRGTEGIKEATLNLAGKDVRIAVINGTANARKVLDDMKAGIVKYDFIEIMACPGGCVNGGGQPIRDAKCWADNDIKALRAKALYEEDKNAPLRKSHLNPTIDLLYKDFFGEPNSHKAHELLHTKYTKRGQF
ncbi:MAG: iron hydrogenase small subunit [Clostridia bacterium]|nr:iron hydrogenase small subunit [Clostridia bacterium]